MAISTISALNGESRNVISTGSTPAMYVPTTGRNWLTMPTHRARAIGAAVPTDWNTIQWKIVDSSASSAREYR